MPTVPPGRSKYNIHFCLSTDVLLMMALLICIWPATTSTGALDNVVESIVYRVNFTTKLGYPPSKGRLKVLIVFVRALDKKEPTPYAPRTYTDKL